MRAAAFALVALAVGVFAPTAGDTSAPVAAQSVDDEACTDGDGVTVVIDFQELGGGVNLRCASGPAESGLDAFTRADIAWEGTRRFPGFVCRIAGRPGPDTEPCGNTPPANAYWSYWLAPRGGTWCYSNLGPGNRTPPPGTVEGWSFALNRATTEIPPPRIDPPPPLPGVAPTPLDPGHCSTPDSSATTVPAASATTPPTAATPAPAPQPDAGQQPPSAPAPAPPSGDEPATAPPAGGDDAGGNSPTPVPDDGATAAAAPNADTATTSTAATTAATNSATTSSTVPPSNSTTTTTIARPGTTTARSSPISFDDDGDEVSAELDAAIPIGDVDLSDDGRGGGGFGATTLFGVVAIALLAGGGFWAARRRRGVT